MNSKNSQSKGDSFNRGFLKDKRFSKESKNKPMPEANRFGTSNPNESFVVDFKDVKTLSAHEFPHLDNIKVRENTFSRGCFSKLAQEKIELVPEVKEIKESCLLQSSSLNKKPFNVETYENKFLVVNIEENPKEKNNESNSTKETGDIRNVPQPIVNLPKDHSSNILSANPQFDYLSIPAKDQNVYISIENEIKNKFIQYDLQDELERVSNLSYEKRIIETFKHHITKAMLASLLLLDSSTWSIINFKFRSFLYEIFPGLKNMCQNTIELNRSPFMNEMLNRKNFQLDGGFFFMFSNKYIDLVEKGKKKLNNIEPFEAQIRDFEISLDYYSLLIIEVTTSKKLSKIEEKIKQVVTNMFLAWYSILQRFKFESENLKNIFQNKPKTKGKKLYRLFKERMGQIPKHCLIITSGNLDQSLEIFNQAYENVSKDKFFKFIITKLKYLNINLSVQNKYNSESIQILGQRANKNFMVQQIHMSENPNEDVLEIKSVVFNEIHKLNKKIDKNHAENKYENNQIKILLKLIAQNNGVRIPDTFRINNNN